MAQNLTRIGKIKHEGLTTKERKERLFRLAFCYRLDKKYNFSCLEKCNIEKFQQFLDKVSNQTVDFVDKAYLKPPDKNDKYICDGIEHGITHYEVSDKFRIHGIYLNELFVVIKIDPNHKFHDGKNKK